MARKTQEEAQRTRRRILAAAQTVFCRQGVAATSLHDVALQAGVTRGAVYGHFANKEALLATLLDGPFPLEKLTPGENLAEDCERLLQALLASLRNPRMRRLLRILLLHAERGEALPYVHGRIMRARRRFTCHLVQMFQHALAAGELPEAFTAADIARATLTLRAILTGLVYDLLQQPWMPQRDDQVREVMRRFFGMLQYDGAAGQYTISTATPNMYPAPRSVRM